MKCLVLPSGRRIAPFDDPVAALRIGDEPLGELRDRLLAAAGLEVVAAPGPEALPDEPCLVTFDDVYVSGPLLEAFVRGGRRPREGEAVALALREAAMTAYLRPLQDLPQVQLEGHAHAVFDLFLVNRPELGDLADAAALRRALRETARPRRVPLAEYVRPVRVPQLGAAPREIRFPVTTHVAAHVGHWVHVLWLNHLVLPALWAEYLTASRWRYLKLAWRARSLDPSVIARRCNVLGEEVDIDPAAILEGCVVRARARIGARAVLRHCVVGEDAVVSDEARLRNCVIGAGSLVMSGTHLANIAAYPRCSLSNQRAQQSLFGEEVFLTGLAVLVDAKFDGEVEVRDGDAIVSAGTPFLGVCLGHRAMLGAGVTVLHGRAIPNDTWIVTRPEDLVRKVPDDLPPRTPLVVRDGRPVPL